MTEMMVMVSMFLAWSVVMAVTVMVHYGSRINNGNGTKAP